MDLKKLQKPCKNLKKIASSKKIARTFDIKKLKTEKKIINLLLNPTGCFLTPGAEKKPE